MEDTQKQGKLPPIKYTKRVGHLFEHVRDIDNLKEAIMLRISRKARTIARAAYASIRNAHAMVSYIGYIVNSDSQRFYEKWVRPFVNIKHLKGVIADEDRKQHQACVAV